MDTKLYTSSILKGRRNGEEALLKEMQKSNPNNIYNIIEISPETLRYIRLFSMAGSIYLGYRNSSHRSKEYNIVDDIPATQKMFFFHSISIFCVHFILNNSNELH